MIYSKEILDFITKKMNDFIAETGKEMSEDFKSGFTSGFFDALLYVITIKRGTQ
jgi:hypothetical protein